MGKAFLHLSREYEILFLEEFCSYFELPKFWFKLVLCCLSQEEP